MTHSSGVSITRTQPQSRAARGPATSLLAVALLSGCYDYVALPASGALPGTSVQATLTDAGSVQMAPVIGPRVASVEGRLVHAGADSLVLHVSKLTLQNGTDNGWGNESVALPLRTVSTLRERQLDKPRTFIGAAVGVGLALAAILTQHRGSETSSVPIGGLPAGQ